MSIGSKIRSRVFADRMQAELALAGEIAALVRAKPDAVLGLATGRTPVGVYRELVRMHGEERLDFSQVVTFNLDEFEGLAPDHRLSFRRFMQDHLFEGVNLAPENTHLLSGDVASDEAPAHCAEFEERILAAGGIDLQVLGIGLNGHIGFNEPGSGVDSRTRRVALHPVTRASFEESVGAEAPTHALTMGVATILEARAIRVLALGAKKRAIVRRMLEGDVSSDVPATFLRGHGDVRVLLDAEAGA